MYLAFDFNSFLILGITFDILLFTMVMRFKFNFQHDKILENIMKRYNLKRAFHFHHLFFGIFVIGAAHYTASPLLGDIGLGIALSDIFYHFAVLWPIVGSPDFTVLIKDIKKFEREQIKERRLLKKFVKHIEGYD